MLTREEVQIHRSRIRNQMKVCLVTPKVEVPSQHLENADEALETRLNKKTGRCRKLSEDLSFFKKARQIKEIYIAESFFDLFNVEEKLGEGAQSVVKKCTELASGNIFAVKLFRSCDCELIEMLKAQYKILTELSHPNIIEGYYLFVNEKSMSCQMVLEYCSFPSLSEVIAQEPLTTQQAAAVISKLAQTVAHLHRHGVCHRDIKPQNILYNRQTGDLKLIDFEIAKVHRTKLERFEMWTNTGSFFYKAPQMFSSGYNQLVDIWALGVVAYQLMTNSLPFYHQYENQTINLIKMSEPAYPHWLPPSAVEFIQKCLEKNPFRRASAHELLQSPLIIGLKTQTLELMSPMSWKNKSCETKSRRDSSDATEPFTISCLHVVEEQEPIHESLKAHDIIEIIDQE